MEKNKKTHNTTRLIKEMIKNFANTTFDTLDAFLFSFGSAHILAKNMRMKESQYHSSIQSLKRSGCIKKVNEDQFLITPKMLTRLAEDKILESDWEQNKWDGTWKIVAFDIPELKKRKRNIFRSLIKRKGFIGIQNSVFIAPFADFKQLAILRSYLKVEKYISFFVAKSAETDDDQQIKERFKLN